MVHVRRDAPWPGSRSRQGVPEANPDVSAEIEKQIRGKMSEVSLPVEGIEEAE